MTDVKTKEPEFELSVQIPKKFLFLIQEPAPYKILYGGRGGAKTETIAIALIILATQHKLRIACFRELQKAISESVYETIKNRIHDLKIEPLFDIQATTIICKKTGSEFIFSGLRYNINSIKSMARIDIAWVEEAANVSKTSWEKLEPTIRGKHESDPSGMGGPFGLGPEIWISFNPELDDDETYRRYVVERHKYAPDFIEEEGKQIRYAFCVKVNYSDNPFLPKDLERKMAIAKKADENDYLHVWEGNTKQTLDGAIFADEIKKVIKEGRRGYVPYDPSRPVQTFWDLGHSDHTAIWFIQQVGIEYNIINYYQDHLKKIGFYLEHLQSLHYVYGKCYMPHDADNETLASRSIKKITQEAGFKVVIVPRIAKKVLGINASRTIFDLCNFDEANTADGWQCLCRYQYDVDENGKWSKEPAHNEYSHGADAFQTFALSLKQETALKKEKKEPVVISSNNFRSSTQWMG